MVFVLFVVVAYLSVFAQNTWNYAKSWVCLSVRLCGDATKGNSCPALQRPERQLSEWECECACSFPPTVSLPVCLSVCLAWLVSYPEKMPFNFDGKRLVCYRWERRLKLLEYGPTGRMRNASSKYMTVARGRCKVRLVLLSTRLDSFSIRLFQFLMHFINFTSTFCCCYWNEVVIRATYRVE